MAQITNLQTTTSLQINFSGEKLGIVMFLSLASTIQHTVLYSKEESFKLTQTHSCRVRCVILKEHYFCKDSKNIFPCGASIINPGRVNLNTVLPVIGTWKLEEYVTLQICWRDAFPLYIISVSNQLCCRSGLEQLCEMTRRRAGGPRNIPAVIREKI